MWCIGHEANQKCAAAGDGTKTPSPSAVWVMVGALYGGGGALLAVTGIAALLIPFLPSTQARSNFAHISSNIQAAAGELFYISNCR